MNRFLLVGFGLSAMPLCGSGYLLTPLSIVAADPFLFSWDFVTPNGRRSRTYQIFCYRLKAISYPLRSEHDEHLLDDLTLRTSAKRVALTFAPPAKKAFPGPPKMAVASSSRQAPSAPATSSSAFTAPPTVATAESSSLSSSSPEGHAIISAATASPSKTARIPKSKAVKGKGKEKAEPDDDGDPKGYKGKGKDKANPDDDMEE